LNIHEALVSFSSFYDSAEISRRC